MRIRHLPENLVNQIAAGEVIERPAAAVRELVENALDAGAKNISVEIADGGKSMIHITDDGGGMSREELIAALDRHATSKLPDDDLLLIKFMGFRGEALPSIASVSRMSVTSRLKGADESWELQIEGGKKSAPRPASLHQGTIVEVRDLFYATPARLKFMKSERAEYGAVKDTLSRLAMAFPAVAFRLTHNGETVLSLPAAAAPADRLSALLGRDFADNALLIEAEREGTRLSGFAGLPTYSRGTAQYQYLFVNGRPVRDRLLIGAIKGAYADVMSRDRHPVAALFLDLPPGEVDVNVHPAKAEVRFRDSAMVRGLVVSAIKHALHEGGQKASPSIGVQTIAAWRVPSVSMPQQQTFSAPVSFRYGGAGLAEKPFEAYQLAGPQRKSRRRKPFHISWKGAGVMCIRELHCRADGGRPCHRRPARRARTACLMRNL